MSDFKKATAKTVADVLVRFAEFVRKRGAEERGLYAQQINEILDDLAAMDAFGTEGQCDPRGDPRK